MSGYDVVAPIPTTPDAEDEWLRARRPYIGASEAAAVLGLSPYSTPRDVWESKRPGAEPIPENRFMQWGKRLEPVVAEWLEHDYPEIGHLVMPAGLMVSRDYPFMAATLDRENTWDDDGYVTGLTEIKTGSAFTRAAWFEDGEPVVPAYYEVQAQQQMLIRGVRKGFVGALIGGNELILREVTFNQAFADVLVSELEEWNETFIVKETPPPSTPRDVWRFSGRTKDEGALRKVGTPEILAKAEKRRLITQPAVSAAKKVDDELKGEVQAFMEDATELVDEDGKVYATWYRGADKTVLDVDALKAAHPAIVEEFMVTKPGSRTMYFKSPK